MKLDHVFILVEPEATVAERLLAHGFQEGTGNTHPGQGTANRRVYFANGMVEFLWVRDADEANNGPGRELHFPKRANNVAASPFGAIFVPDTSGADIPFPGWHYQPDYFPAPKGFRVGANSNNIAEPLCFYFPLSVAPKVQPARNPQTISQITISTPSADTKGILKLASQTEGFSIRTGREHLMEITLDNHRLGRTEDFRPAMPLVLHW